MEPIILTIDIDGTICTDTKGQYSKAKPYKDRIKIVNHCYDSGFYIKFFTARGTTTRKNWRKLTTKQLKSWGVKYHELLFGKPHSNFFIDDKNVLPEDFFGTMKKRCE